VACAVVALDPSVIHGDIANLNRLKQGVQAMKAGGSFSRCVATLFFASIHCYLGQASAQAQLESPVGTTQGTFQATAAGAAQYTIPIEVSPGAGGIEPDLSIRFDSTSGVSFLGPRFQVSGLSQISRCPATIAQDGMYQPVNFDTDISSRYCLDGKRLVSSEPDSGPYRTEIDDFRDVRPAYGSGSDPEEWTVRTKSGLTMTYGGRATVGSCAQPAASRIEGSRPNYPQGHGRNQLWLLSRVEDSAGNWMEFCYEDFDSGSGVEVLPVSIHYTGNDRAGLVPFAQVEFRYRDTSGSPTQAYFLGAEQSKTQLLETVTTSVRSEVTRQYRFSYESRGAAEREYLTSVKECSSATAADHECMLATRFAWEISASGLESSPHVATASAPHGRYFQFPADRNADGRSDIYAVRLDGSYASAWVFEASSGDRAPQIQSSILDSTIHNSDDWRALAGDYSGDGRTDVAVTHVQDHGIEIRTYLADEDSGFGGRNVTYISDVHVDLTDEDVGNFSGDINGDGRADIVFAHNSSYLALISDGDGGFEERAGFLYRPPFDPPVETDDSDAYLSDVNGDGLADYVELGYDGGTGFYVSIYLNQGAVGYEAGGEIFSAAFTGPISDSAQGGHAERDFSLADINGDRNLDIVSVREHGERNIGTVFLGRGDGTFAPAKHTDLYSDSSVIAVAGNRRATAGDVNGDGMQDLVLYRTVNGVTHSWVLFGRPDGELVEGPERQAGGHNAGTLVHARDISGSGRSDLAMARIDGWGARLSLFRSAEGLPSRVSGIVNGLNSLIEIDYSTLSDDEVYEAYAACGGYPTRVLCGGTQVVSAHRVHEIKQVPEMREVKHTYSDFRTGVTGRGLLGPRMRSVYDTSTDTREITYYNQHFPYTGLPDFSRVYVGDALVERDTYSHDSRVSFAASPNAIFPYREAHTKREYKLGGGVYRSTREINEYSEPEGAFYGNVTRSETKVFEGGLNGAAYITESVHEYENDTSQWHLGRLSRSEVTRSAPGQSFKTRVSAFEYDAVTGLLSAEIVQPGTSLELRTDYQRDAIGNITRTRRSGPGAEDRVSTAEFALAAPNFGRGETRSCNALDHCTTREFEAEYAQPVVVIGPNGDEVQYGYDDFGREVSRTESASGRSLTETTERDWCMNEPGACAPEDGVWSHYVRTTASTGEAQVAVYDQQEREVVRKTRNGDGDWIAILTEYTETGEVGRVSKPFRVADGGPAFWTRYFRDAVGRVIEETSPCGDHGAAICKKAYAYDGLRLVETDRRGHRTTRWKNALGGLKRVQDAEGTTITHQYDGFENLVRTVKSAPGKSDVVTTMTYDRRGRKVAMDDPDKGRWTYQYNVFDELVSQTDARGQTTTIEYDAIGREIRREEDDAATTWVYDEDRIGALSEVSYRPRGLLAGGPRYDRRYSYHPSGLIAEESVRIGLAGFRSTTYEYDSHGRLVDTEFPSGFVKTNHYNEHGALDEVSSPTTGVTYWRAQQWDKWGVSETRYGNGIERYVGRDAAQGHVRDVFSGSQGGSQVQRLSYSWDPVGNLAERVDLNQNNLRETFDYDQLDRLERVQLHGVPGVGGAATTMAIDYDAWGNIRSKSGKSYSYTNSRPHAVSAVDGQSYSYDANGNVLDDGERTYRYTSFDLPDRIRQGLTTVRMHYGPERQRIRQRAGGLTTDYYGAHYEVHKRLLSNVQKHFIDTPEGVAAIVDTNAFGNVTTTRYLLRDHQGSVDVVTGEQGQILQNLSFDAFGKPRPASWEGDLPSDYSFETTRGYTGHEHLHAVGLIHMNGRVYDPELGRFLGADPHVQFPGDTQAYDRYSYVLNNPMRYVDPSGFFSLGDVFDGVGDALGGAWDFLEDNWRPLTAVAITVASGGAALGAAGPLAATGWAAAGGFAAGFVASGGDFEAALIGAAAGAASFGIGRGFAALRPAAVGGRLGKRVLHVVSHGIVGGARASALGGKFQRGFLSAGAAITLGPTLSSAAQRMGAGPGGQAAAVVVAGGTAAELGGGKFANGAVTGAFSYGLGGVMRDMQNGASFGDAMLDLAGKVWALPNTVVGLAVGGVSYGAGLGGYGLGLLDVAPSISIGNNAIQFENILFGNGALTLGNTITYGGGTAPSQMGNLYGDPRYLNVGRHEMGHTYQYQAYGPFFLPAYFLSGGISATNPFEQGANDYAAGGSWWP
jgi:RHS repeat-associated protein